MHSEERLAIAKNKKQTRIDICGRKISRGIENQVHFSTAS
jgi:hypothetical protein